MIKDVFVHITKNQPISTSNNGFGIPLLLLKEDFPYKKYRHRDIVDSNTLNENEVLKKAIEKLYKQDTPPNEFAVFGISDFSQLPAELGNLLDKEWRQLVLVDPATTEEDIQAVAGLIETSNKTAFINVGRFLDLDVKNYSR